jgi:AcrR family transcriptional regulator
MPSPRQRSASGTRAAILAAARTRFAAEGYERTTLRAVAADVGVDAAMVHRYFGTKETLFAEAAEFDLRLPDLTGVRPEGLAAVLLPRFFAVWEDDTTFLALLRASVTSPKATEVMREVFAAQVAPALGVVAPDHALERAGLLGSLVLGLAMARYIVATPTMATMERDELVAWVAPLLSEILTGPAPTPPTDDAPGLTG